MTSQAADTTVQSSVIVSASQEHAFSVFTEGIGSWWPPDHHILQGELAEMVFEPHVGGAVYRPSHRWDRVSLGSGARLRFPAPVRDHLEYQP